MINNNLTDTAIKNAKPKDKDYRLTDGQGLYILIKPNGAKWWRFDYSFEGKRLSLSLGIYPQVSLANVRLKANQARIDIANGLNPSDIRKAKKQAIQRNAKNEKEHTHPCALCYAVDCKNIHAKKYIDDLMRDDLITKPLCFIS